MRALPPVQIGTAIAACATYGAARGRLTWVWYAGVGGALSLVILIGFWGGFWAMFLGAGLVVLAAVIGGTRSRNLERGPVA